MERLTTYEKGELVLNCTDCPVVCYDAAHCVEILKQRLAAYEDTGLSPDEIMGMIREKEDVLPCKIGDSLFFITSMYAYLDEPREERVRKIEVFDNNSTLIRTETRAVKPERIGEVVFFTREAAEKALEEKQE